MNEVVVSISKVAYGDDGKPYVTSNIFRIDLVVEVNAVSNFIAALYKLPGVIHVERLVAE